MIKGWSVHEWNPWTWTEILAWTMSIGPLDMGMNGHVWTE